MLQDELLAEALKDDIGQLPFLYENTQFLAIDNLQEAGKAHVVPLVLQMLQNIGLERLQGLCLELKFDKNAKKAETDEEKEKKEKEEKEAEEKKKAAEAEAEAKPDGDQGDLPFDNSDNDNEKIDENYEKIENDRDIE